MSYNRNTSRNRIAARLDNIPYSDYHGINNPASLCYLTSVLHVLSMTPRFPEAVKRGSATHSLYLDPNLDKLFSDLEKCTADINDIAMALGITEADIYEQRDAAEYFQKILCGTSPEASEMFQGTLKRCIKCHGCRTKNKTDDPFWSLPISVGPGLRLYSANNLEMAFEDVFTPTTLTGDNTIYCDRCQAREDATIVCSWQHPPQILTLQLKRFQLDYLRNRYEKITCCIDVPQKLHIKGCDYELYARINHYGSLTCGHYTATIKSYETGGWYDFDDARVRLLRPQPCQQGETAKSSSAYLLMYRRAPRPPAAAGRAHAECVDERVAVTSTGCLARPSDYA
ncbi:ubiquitin carboxyl-terminal hydrolase 47-like isoform X1 [Gadus chalcogrammus]|uniref:ubiquitin carboxyl-terminal hydrolase 47-like isoform X1 n=1 Tax=Gadus chalcogrammus TaxID=1042646 RepID=UPI0024C4D5E7|nr:ubiquitin carboxyl-terminal hydrolase 47-like isoform X1 [Gadus chalcogrammus]XP_056431791.1 ubiquitin carboxyl-terminal hydrolase 47-like isoform X1 [Gadus chalcogrammus]